MKKENLTYELLHEEKNVAVESLFNVYRKNPFNARVIYMNNNKSMYEYHRLVLFKEGNDFNIVLFRKRFGISKTNRMYNSEARKANISYKNGKFYLISDKLVRPLTYRTLYATFGFFTHNVCDYLFKDFSWLRFIIEKDVLNDIAFNTIISKKLYSFKKAIIHEYNIPYPIGKVLHEIKTESNNFDVITFVKHFKKNLEYLDNITSLNPKLLKLNNNLFIDTVRMAKILNEKVNCKWKEKRLKEMHDLWSERITDITYTEADRKMNINPIFYKFSEFTGFKLLTTTKEMALEGKKNNHCVATYVNKVESNNCGIYHIDGYTLEVVNNWSTKGIIFSQFRGYKNMSAPAELNDLVKQRINQFNVEVLGLSINEQDATHDLLELPF